VSGQSSPKRALKAGGPPAVITAGIGIGATGIAGQGIENRTDPIAGSIARMGGIDPQWGPLLLVVLGVLVLVVGFVVPSLFEGDV